MALLDPRPAGSERQRPALTPRQIRDLVGIALVLAGAVVLVVTGFAWSPYAGGVVLGVEMIAAGLLLGMDW